MTHLNNSMDKLAQKINKTKSKVLKRNVTKLCNFINNDIN